jgi:uncharacterized protein YjeT (DUF2065 family)
VQLLAGDPPPPTKSNKALRAGYWAGLPILMGVLINVLEGLGTFYPEAPDWLLRGAGYILMVLGPVFAYLGVYRTKDLLRQPVETIEGVDLDGVAIAPLVDEEPVPPQTPPATAPPRPAPEVNE